MDILFYTLQQLHTVIRASPATPPIGASMNIYYSIEHKVLIILPSPFIYMKIRQDNVRDYIILTTWTNHYSSPISFLLALVDVTVQCWHIYNPKLSLTLIDGET